MKITKAIEETEFPANYHSLPPTQQLKTFWPVIVIVLSFVKIFTGEKADAKIDEIIAWGNENVK